MLTPERFAQERRPMWSKLQEMVTRCGGRPERLGAGGVLELGELYRATAADLAQARRDFGVADPLSHELEGLVTRARQAVYSQTRKRVTLLTFFSTHYWQLIWERKRALALAGAVFIGVTLLALYWGITDPTAAGGVVPSWAHDPTAPLTGDKNLSAADSAAFSSEIFTNNIQVTFYAFAGGLLFGLGTLMALLQNGMMLGAIFGVAIEYGNGESLYRLIVAHGVIELSCIVIAAAAGFSIGKALIEPGTLTRRASLVKEAKDAILIVLGTMPWLVLAGLIEGYISPSGLDTLTVSIIGFAVGGIYWFLLLWRGRKSANNPAPN